MAFRDIKLRTIQPIIANLPAVYMFEIVATRSPELMNFNASSFSLWQSRQSENMPVQPAVS